MQLPETETCSFGLYQTVEEYIVSSSILPLTRTALSRNPWIPVSGAIPPHMFELLAIVAHHLPNLTGCDTPIPGVPLTTRQPSKYSWMSSNLTPQHRVPFFGTHDLTKIGQSLICMGSSTQNTTCRITWQHGPILYNDHIGSTYE